MKLAQRSMRFRKTQHPSLSTNSLSQRLKDYALPSGT
jgi:hypothetical protein